MTWLSRYIKDTGNNLLSAAQVRSYIGQGLEEGEGSYGFYKATTGWYRCDLFGEEERCLLLANSATPFTADSGLDYEVGAGGHIYVSNTGVAASHSSATISITGTRVNLRKVMPPVFVYLASRASKDVAASLGMSDYDPNMLAARLIKMAEWWRGGVTH